MAPHLMGILPHMWNTLTQSADRYVRTVVNYTDDADDPVDSDGKKHNYFKLISDIAVYIILVLYDEIWWMTSYSLSLLHVFTKTKLGPVVQCRV